MAKCSKCSRPLLRTVTWQCLQCGGPGESEVVERLQALCRDLVGEEVLHQGGKYETEMQRLRARIAELEAEEPTSRDVMECARKHREAAKRRGGW